MNRAMLRGVGALPEITMTRRDHSRLESLLREHAPIRSWKAVAFLIEEMDRAKILADDQIEPTVVTIHARVAFREDGRDDTMVASLTLPGERDLYPDAMSILTPTGAALIGLSEGQSIGFTAADGRAKTVTVAKVLYQPQAVRPRARHVARRFRWQPTD